MIDHIAGSGTPSVLIGLLVIVVLVVRRTRGQRLGLVTLFILPTILLIVGTLATVPSLHNAHIHAIDSIVVALDVLISIGLGTVRGLSVRLYDHGGTIWYRYGAATVMLWGASIAIRFLLGIAGAAWGASEVTVSSAVLFMLGVSLFAQNTVVEIRARRRAGSHNATALS
jgi:hypothetical protein